MHCPVPELDRVAVALASNCSASCAQDHVLQKVFRGISPSAPLRLSLSLYPSVCLTIYLNLAALSLSLSLSLFFLLLLGDGGNEASPPPEPKLRPQKQTGPRQAKKRASALPCRSSADLLGLMHISSAGCSCAAQCFQECISESLNTQPHSWLQHQYSQSCNVRRANACEDDAAPSGPSCATAPDKFLGHGDHKSHCL